MFTDVAYLATFYPLRANMRWTFVIAFALARASSAAFLKRRVTTDVRDFFFFERFEVSMRVLFSPGVCVCVWVYIYTMGDRCDRKTARTVTERNP